MIELGVNIDHVATVRQARRAPPAATTAGPQLVEANNLLGLAYDRSCQLEWLCQVWLLARAVGDPILLPQEELERVVGRRVRSISYPHGKADGRVAAAAREAGFDWGFTGVAEAVTPASDPLRLPRVEVEQSSPAGFARQLVATLERARSGSGGAPTLG